MSQVTKSYPDENVSSAKADKQWSRRIILAGVAKPTQYKAQESRNHCIEVAV